MERRSMLIPFRLTSKFTILSCTRVAIANINIYNALMTPVIA